MHFSTNGRAYAPRTEKDSEMRLQNYQRYVLDTIAMTTGQKLRV